MAGSGRAWDGCDSGHHHNYSNHPPSLILILEKMIFEGPTPCIGEKGLIHKMLIIFATPIWTFPTIPSLNFFMASLLQRTPSSSYYSDISLQIVWFIVCFQTSISPHLWFLWLDLQLSPSFYAPLNPGYFLRTVRLPTWEHYRPEKRCHRIKSHVDYSWSILEYVSRRWRAVVLIWLANQREKWKELR